MNKTTIDTGAGRTITVNGPNVQGEVYLACRSAHSPGWTARLTAEQAVEVAEALTAEAPSRPLAVGDLVYKTGSFRRIVIEITDSGYVIAEDSDDGALMVSTVSDALEGRAEAESQERRGV